MSRSAEEILEESKAALRLYFNSEIDRVKLILVRNGTRILSMGLKMLVLLGFGIVASIFILTAIALYWGKYLDNYPLALLYTGFCSLGLMVIVYLIRNTIITKPIMHWLMNELFKEDE